MAIRKDLVAEDLAGNPRCTLEAWLRYRPYVEAAFGTYPEVYVVTPANFTSATFASRIRDAVRGAIVFQYPCAIPQPTLIDWWSKVVVRLYGDKVKIGPPDKIDVTVREVLVRLDQTTSEHSNVTDMERDAFYILISSGRIPPPVIFNQVWPGWDPGHPNVQILVKDGKTLFI